MTIIQVKSFIWSFSFLSIIFIYQYIESLIFTYFINMFCYLSLKKQTCICKHVVIKMIVATGLWRLLRRNIWIAMHIVFRIFFGRQTFINRNLPAEFWFHKKWHLNGLIQSYLSYTVYIKLLFTVYKLNSWCSLCFWKIRSIKQNLRFQNKLFKSQRKLC